jgi:putative restriction endonuclease
MANGFLVRSVIQRRGQQTFRNHLIQAYDGRCAISGCGVLDVLEAAHIVPYLGPATNKVSNGLLLRADLHTLFDCGLIGIDPATLTVVVAKRLLGGEYGALQGVPIAMPSLVETEELRWSISTRHSQYQPSTLSTTT